MLNFFDFIESEKKISNMIYIPVFSLKLFYHMYLYIQIYCNPTFAWIFLAMNQPFSYIEQHGLDTAYLQT